VRTLAVLFLALGVFLAGCGGDDLDDETGSTRSALNVAEDEDASAAEIIAAGRPVDAEGAGDGSRLVLYRVVGETGDVEQTAWRLYGPDGHPVADGKGGDTVLGAGDGFWLGDAVVAADGTARAPATAAELLVSGGPGWEPVRGVPVRPGQHLLGFGLTPVGDHVVLPVVRPARGEQIAVEAVAVRRADAPAAAAWTVLGAGPLTSDLRDAFPRAFALDDRHYVFSDLRRQPYLLDVRSGRWSGLPLPTDEHGWTLEPGRDGLYAFPPSGSEEPADAWFSTDLGANWDHLPR
jgi:hypothetical protein